MRRPARWPPACFSVRPGNTMTMFSPSAFVFFRCPCLKPSPMATISTIDATPQAIPAIVSTLRSLLRMKLEATCRKTSIAPLLQNDGLPFAQAAQDLGLGSVADARRDSHAPLPFFRAGVGNFDL